MEALVSNSFDLIREEHVAEISATARLYVHTKTGARLLSIQNDDENKTFGITFRTPPASSNGIAHILEHAVLGGSRKYPVKEPFVELLKGSLSTFVNAMTFPDKTSYPVASTNLQDFYNLVDVYLDAVFYPNITEATLRQEGWHYDLESPDAPLTFKGIVYNEMKGAYSSPDSVINRLSERVLFPETPYGFDSGGDPTAIPDLTYDEFKRFYESFYHPSNAYIWFSGDDPEERRLNFLGEWLDAFERREPNSDLPLQPHWDAPQRVTKTYDAGEDAKAFITVNWLLPESGDGELMMGLSILSHILTATPASPLRKALMDSGLGEDLTGGGFEDSLRQMVYSTGMKGVQPENLERVEALIIDTLQGLATEGIDPDTVAASLNTLEFRMREQNSGQFPRGLVLMFNALSTWLYDGDPIAALRFEADLNAIKERLAGGERYFESLIQSHLLDNPHRATVTLEPDPEENKRLAEAEAARLAQAKASMSAADLEWVMESAAELRQLQEAPNSPEALATIPSLQLSDLERQGKTIPLALDYEGGATLLYHDLFTNGIAYLDLGFDLHSLPQPLLPLAGIFGRALLQMGTTTQNFVQLTQRIGQSTGGIYSSSLTTTVRDSTEATLWFFLRGKAVMDQTGELLAILRDVLLTANFDNRERFKQIISEEKARLEASLVPGGHAVVNRRLRARFTTAGWVDEQINGVEYLKVVRRLVERTETDWPSVLADLEATRRALINRNAMIVNVTLDEANWQIFRPQLAAFLQDLPSIPAAQPAWNRQIANGNEGLTIPAQVNYVGKGANLFALGYEPHGSAHVINKYLGTTWLWEKIRVQGGAYGGFSVLDMNSGVFTYLSYRDPNLLKTLENYDNTPHFLSQLDLSELELTRSIIGTIGDMDPHLLPDAKGYVSMVRYLTRYTDEERQRIREEVLGTSVDDFKQFALMLEKVAQQGEVVILGSADAIEKANAERQGLLQVAKLL
jgi:Zn-dependent M16 (insulinase) family peptidase